MMLCSLAMRNMGRNLRRTILSGTALAFSALVMALFFSLYEGIRIDLRENVRNHLTGDIRIQHRDFEKNSRFHPLGLAILQSEDLASIVESSPLVQAISPRISFGTGIYRDGATYRAQAQGVDFDREKKYQDLEKVLLTGRLPRRGEPEALLARGLAREMGIGLDDKITLLVQTRGRGTNALSLRIVGLAQYPVAAFDGGFLLLPLERAERLLRMEGMATEILVKLRPGTDEEAAARELDRLAKAEGELWVEQDFRSWKKIGYTYSIIRMFELSYTLIGLVLVLLGSTVIINTTMMVVFERTREIGTLSALGMDRRGIVLLFALEAALIGAAGALFGVLLGAGIVVPLSRVGISFGAAMGEVAIEISQTLYPVVTVKSTVLVFFYTLLVSVPAALIPARRAAKIRPVDALRAGD